MRTRDFLQAWRATSPHLCIVCGDPVGPDGALCDWCAGEPPHVQLRGLPPTIRLGCGCIADWRDLGGMTEDSHLFRLRPVVCVRHGDTHVADLLRIPGELTRDTRLGVALAATWQRGRLVVTEIQLGTFEPLRTHGTFTDLPSAALYALAHLARRRAETFHHAPPTW